MAVTSRLYPAFIKSLLNKETDFDTNVLKAMLVTSGYTFDPTHQYKSSITNEITGTGYTAGGATCASATVTVTVANSWGTSRANSTAYTVGQVIRPATGNGFLYQVSTAGTSGASIPTFPTTIGSTVTDGTAVLTCLGTAIIVFDCADPSWTTATLTARACVVYDSSPASDATRPLVAFIDLGADVSATAGTFSVVLDASLGLGYVAV